MEYTISCKAYKSMPFARRWGSSFEGHRIRNPEQMKDRFRKHHVSGFLVWTALLVFITHPMFTDKEALAAQNLFLWHDAQEWPICGITRAWWCVSTTTVRMAAQRQRSLEYLVVRQEKLIWSKRGRYGFGLRSSNLGRSNNSSSKTFR